MRHRTLAPLARGFAVGGVASILAFGCLPSGVRAPTLQPQRTFGAPRSLKASAPQGLDAIHLGVAHDQFFNPIPGAQLFPQAGRPAFTPLNEMRHEVVIVETEEDLAANAKAWGVVSGGTSIGSTNRHAAYRAYQLSHVLELNDSSTMGQPPPGTVYYPWRIFYGHSYEEVLTGDARTFNAGVKARFLSWGGSISTFASSTSLARRMTGRGLVPVQGDAIFARTPAEIQQGYRAVGPPVPIFVEFRQLPYSQALSGAVGWLTPQDVDIRFTELRVANDGTWGSTPWRVEGDCRVNGNRFPVQDLLVFDGRVKSPATYPVSWGTRLSLFPGDVVECGTSGTLQDHVTSPTPIGAGRMQPVTIGPGVATAGEFVGANAKSRYAVRWTLRASYPQQ